MHATVTKADSAHESAPTESTKSQPAANGSAQQSPLWAQTLSPLQAKLTINRPGDKYEREADRVADQVMRMPGGEEPGRSMSGARDRGNGQCSICSATKELVRRKPLPTPITQLFQDNEQVLELDEDEEDKGIVQTKEAGGPTPVVAPQLARNIGVMRGGGQPLTNAVRGFFEPRFGADFSGVRVHSGPRATATANAINARAYTLGRDIVFGSNQYAPDTAEGKELLAHELTHTLQQGRGSSTVQRAIKFEFQTSNYVWRVDKMRKHQTPKSFRPIATPLPRKYSPSGRTEERGDRPAYLSVGHRGGPARKKGHVGFEEAKGPLTMKETKAGIDAGKAARFVIEFKFKTAVKPADLIGQPARPGRVELTGLKDNANDPAMNDKWNPDTFEFKYMNADGSQLMVHMDRDDKFAAGHVRHMVRKKGTLQFRRAKYAVDATKEAQFVFSLRFWTPVKLTDIINEKYRFGQLMPISMIDNSTTPAMDDKWNPGTTEFRYFNADGSRLMIHLDPDGKYAPGHIRHMVQIAGAGPFKRAKYLVDAAKVAQIQRVYQFKAQVNRADILGKPAPGGQLELVGEQNNAADTAMDGKYNPNTFEFKYLNADGSDLKVHLDQDRKFAAGHVEHMRLGRQKRTDIDKKQRAQYEEVWKVTSDPMNGDVDLLGQRVRVEMVSVVDNASAEGMGGAYNSNTWEKNYYKDSDFDSGTLKPGSLPLDLHRAKDGTFRAGHVKFMEQAPALEEAKEQTGIELQSENHGVLEFETPKWFGKWSDLEARIQEAVDMTKAIDSADEIKDTPADTEDAKVLEDMRTKIGDSTKPKSLIGSGERTEPLGSKVVAWPEQYSTAHLKRLVRRKRRLIVEIVDPDWYAAIQSSEGVALSRFESLAEEHDDPYFKLDVPVIDLANKVFDAAFTAAKAKDASLNVSRFADLKGFLQLVVSYIARGQTIDLTGTYAKAGFRLMARTNFGSMYKHLLSDEEKALFKSIINDKNDPILAELSASISSARGVPLTLTRKSRFFFRKVGTNKKTATYGPTIHKWLVKMTKGKDALSGPGFSGAMGAKTVSTEAGDKDYKRALFEVRGTESHGGRVQKRDDWMKYVKAIFDAAAARSVDTPDDPTTALNEASRTSLRK